MTNTKKAHLIYALISVFAVIAYLGFTLRDAIREVDTVEETLPYEEEFLIEEVTEEKPVILNKALKEAESPSAPTELETDFIAIPQPEGFSPILPVKGSVVNKFSLSPVYNNKTQDWRSHMGIDITAPVATRVFSCEDGTITAVYEDPFWGNVIEIDHGEYVSIYKNLSTLVMVKEGDFVNRGDTISGVGDNCVAEDLSTPHIHFELLHFGEYTDPEELID